MARFGNKKWKPRFGSQVNHMQARWRTYIFVLLVMTNNHKHFEKYLMNQIQTQYIREARRVILGICLLDWSVVSCLCCIYLSALRPCCGQFVYAYQSTQPLRQRMHSISTKLRWLCLYVCLLTASTWCGLFPKFEAVRVSLHWLCYPSSLLSTCTTHANWRE